MEIVWIHCGFSGAIANFVLWIFFPVNCTNAADKVKVIVMAAVTLACTTDC
jgi:hypothetical protein